MKPLFHLFVLLCMSASCFADDFNAANEAYAAEKYADAKKLYLKTLESGPQANVFYNLGNTCFRLGEFGPAAAAYERALALKPSYHEAAVNLRFLREKTSARVAPVKWYQTVFSAMPAQTALLTGLGVTWLGLLLLGFSLWRRMGWLGGFGAVTVILLGAVYAAGVSWQDKLARQGAIVTGEKLEARLDPSDRSGVAETLSAGSRVTIKGGQGSWLYCALPNGSNGWVKTAEIEQVYLR